jgi:hypothetical protein
VACNPRGGDIIAILREAHRAMDPARARSSTALGADLLDKLRERYDEASRTSRHEQVDEADQHSRRA